MNKFLIATCLLGLAVSVYAGPIEQSAPVATVGEQGKPEPDVPTQGRAGVCLHRLIKGLEKDQFVLAHRLARWYGETIMPENLDDGIYLALAAHINKDFGIRSDCSEAANELHKIFHNDEDGCLEAFNENEADAFATDTIVAPFYNAIKVCEAVFDYAEKKKKLTKPNVMKKADASE